MADIFARSMFCSPISFLDIFLAGSHMFSESFLGGVNDPSV
jgi:hypothetical protein